ncbi:MAG: hypothetical protein C0596_13675 [Marinilabiliales bacterium]|nr:MAG: hypothetical protein C0596_13675 [Marinilabiliales bacterium]
MFNITSSAQETLNSINDRYIVIDNIETFFEFSDNSVVCYPVIHNIYVDESSKPLHLGVNELPNVIKFSIKSNAEAFENQRQSKLVMNTANYLDTFRSALIKINVMYVQYDNEFLTVDQFYLLSK